VGELFRQVFAGGPLDAMVSVAAGAHGSWRVRASWMMDGERVTQAVETASKNDAYWLARRAADDLEAGRTPERMR
jgi:hypothetical protein